MTFGQSISTCFSKYVTFSGRAQRSEFWWFALFGFVGNMVLGMIDSVLFGTVETAPGSFSASTDTPIISGIFALAIFLPAISVAVRRLHDTDRTGWWYWILLVPLVGLILLIVWFATEGTRGKNRYGDDPLNPGLGGGTPAGDGGAVYTASDVPNIPRD